MSADSWEELEAIAAAVGVDLYVDVIGNPLYYGEK